MRKSRQITAAAAVAVVAAVAAMPAFGGSGVRRIPFRASYTGKATSKVTGDRVDIVAHGTGLGTPIGRSTLAGVGAGTKSGDANCVPFSGPGSMVTTAIPRLTLKFAVQPSSSGCAGEDQNQVTVSGTARFTGGTGKYRLARGTFTFSGYYNRTSGAFSVKFTGTLLI